MRRVSGNITNVVPPLIVRRGASRSITDQLIAQFELAILTGHLREGERLPSIRALARRLAIHPRSVYEAYRGLTARRRLAPERGSGTYVRGGPAMASSASAHDPLVTWLVSGRLAGRSIESITSEVQEILQAPIVVTDSSVETAQVMAAEVAETVKATVEACPPHLVSSMLSSPGGAVVACLGAFEPTVRELAPAAPIVRLRLISPWSCAKMVAAMPPDGLAVVVSHSAAIRRFVEHAMMGLREDIAIESSPLHPVSEWRGAAMGADLIVCDALSAPYLRGCEAPLHVYRTVTIDTP